MNKQEQILILLTETVITLLEFTEALESRNFKYDYGSKIAKFRWLLQQLKEQKE